MKSQKKLLLIVTLLIFFALVLVTIRAGWKNAKKNAVKSCILSIHASLRALSRSQDFKLSVNVQREWEVLSEDDANRLILAAANSGHIDCDGKASSKPSFDYWNNQLQIAVRQASTDRDLEFRVWSKGPDGISETSDDIVSTEEGIRSNNR